MVKKLLMFVTCVWMGVTSINAQDTATIKQQIEQAAAQVQSMDCDFVQTKHLKMLNEKMVSKGRLSYRQPSKLRWEYIHPYSYVFILNDNKVIIKNEYSSDEINIQNNKMFKEIVRIMMNTVVGKCLSDEKRFEVNLIATEKEWIADLMPRGKDMKQMFYKISIHFEKKAMMVSSIEISEKNGDKTVVELKNIQLNKPLDEKVFSIHN